MMKKRLLLSFLAFTACVVAAEAATVTVNYDAVQCPGLVAGYSVNYGSELTLSGSTFTVADGDVVTLALNTERYKVTEVSVDGTSQDMSAFYGSVEFAVPHDLTVDIKAHRYGELTAWITVDNPEALSVYAGYRLPENLVSLTSGRNEVKVPEDAPVISWQETSGYEITGVSSTQLGVIDASSVTVTDGLELTFTTRATSLDNSFVLWADDITAAQYYFRLATAGGNALTVQSGYNVIAFNADANPYSVGFAGAPFGQLFVNGSLIDPLYAGSTYWETNLAVGDVVKVFCASMPVECSVTFDVEGDASATVTADIVTPCPDWRQGISCLAGTCVAIAPGEDAESVSCEVNGVAVEPDVDGLYQFTVESPATIVSLKLDRTQGVSDAVCPDIDADAAVYNLQGVKVGTADTVSSLPAGLYIMAGRLLKR